MYPNQGQLPSLAETLKDQAKLFKKVINVVKGVEKIEKSGYNSHQKYHYSTEQDLVNAVRQLLLDNQLLVLTDSETKEVVKVSKSDKDGKSKETLVTVVNTRHTFCDVETGFTYPIQSTGAGWDDTDKGVYKGLTGAMKYFISKNFLVATEDDPENDGETVKTPPVKGFSRTANKAVEAAKPAETTTVQVTSATGPNGTVSETTVVETPAAPADTSQVAEKRARPSFGRRTTTKQEPNFP